MVSGGGEGWCSAIHAGEVRGSREPVRTEAPSGHCATIPEAAVCRMGPAALRLITRHHLLGPPTQDLHILSSTSTQKKKMRKKFREGLSQMHLLPRVDGPARRVGLFPHREGPMRWAISARMILPKLDRSQSRALASQFDWKPPQTNLCSSEGTEPICE
jgi:hypothetical protein